MTITGNNGEFEISGLIDGDEYGIGASYDQERFGMQKHFTAEKNKRTLDDIVLKVNSKNSYKLQPDSNDSSEVNSNDDRQSSSFVTPQKVQYTLTVANLDGVGIPERQAETVSNELKTNVSQILDKTVGHDTVFEYVEYDRTEEKQADIMVIGTACKIGDKCTVFVRLVHVETGRIVACLKRYQEDSFDTIIADISADIGNLVLNETWVESALVAMPYGSEQICYNLTSLDLEPNNIDIVEAQIVSEKLRSEIYQLVLSPAYRNKNLREKFVPAERAQMQKILDHLVVEKADSGAIEYGKFLRCNALLIGSVNKIGNTYVVMARIVDVETSNTIHESEIRGSVDEVLHELIPDIAQKLVYGKQ